jgi:hypothetical protein
MNFKGSKIETIFGKIALSNDCLKKVFIHQAKVLRLAAICFHKNNEKSIPEAV